jgi:hypothetical protein
MPLIPKTQIHRSHLKSFAVNAASKRMQTYCFPRGNFSSISAILEGQANDRAADIRISASLVETIASSNIPKELRSFTKELDLYEQIYFSQALCSFPSRSMEPANPPLTLTLDGVPYILSSTSQIRRDHRLIESPKEITYGFVIETTIDPDDGQQLMVCNVRKFTPF